MVSAQRPSSRIARHSFHGWKGLVEVLQNLDQGLRFQDKTVGVPIKTVEPLSLRTDAGIDVLRLPPPALFKLQALYMEQRCTGSRAASGHPEEKAVCLAGRPVGGGS